MVIIREGLSKIVKMAPASVTSGARGGTHVVKHAISLKIVLLTPAHQINKLST